MWAAVHGMVVLRLAGMWHDAPDFDALHEVTQRLIFEGARTPRGKPTQARRARSVAST
jgi:hypothetical protein